MEVEGGDVGGVGGHVGVHVAVVGFDEGVLGDGGAGEAVELGDGVFVGEIGCGDVDLQLGCAGAVDFGEEADAFVGEDGEEGDAVVVECEAYAFHGAGDGDGDLAVGEGGGAEGGGGDGAVGAPDVSVVDDEVGVVVGQRVLVEFDEDVALGHAFGVGLVGEAVVGGGREDSREFGEDGELGSLELLLGGAGVLDEGVVGTVDVSALPHGADGRAEFSDLDTHVSARIFAHGWFSFSC